MNITPKRIIIGISILIVGILIGIAIPALVQKQQDFEKYVKARDQAEDKEQFDKNFDNMVKWFDDYKRNNPGATDEDASKAFNELWD